ncbi:MAG: hypothetical protein KDK51_02460 [Deltaproteobacteria bacterium]|nr:hypothetical protein [Deltaproteobacteria bacterium]
MDLDYWKKRWQDNQTHWHVDRIHPLLQKYYPLLSQTQDSHVLLPLSGKTLDIEWLLEQGHQVTCVEVSDIAIEEIQKRMDIQWQIEKKGPFTVYTYQKLTILQGDYFLLPEISLPHVDFVFDRAAFVAIDPQDRTSYAKIYQHLQPKHILLVLFRYDLTASTHPPYAFADQEIFSLLEPSFDIKLLESKEMLEEFPRFKARNIAEFFQDAYLANLRI